MKRICICKTDDLLVIFMLLEQKTFLGLSGFVFIVCFNICRCKAEILNL